MLKVLNRLYLTLRTIKNPQDINYDTIKRYLKEPLDSKILLYIIDYNGFTEEIKLRIIELILAAQSPEVSAKMVNCNSSFEWNQNDVCDAGYTFIHLALYGMSNNDTDNTNTSYTTEFICNLIEIAKKYGFNVNAVTNDDDDNDTIAHTAIASEEYTGKIVPILKALGDEFNLHAVNHSECGNMNLMQAYEFYMNLAKSCRKKMWHIRLFSEFDEFKAYLESQKVDFPKQDTSKETGAGTRTSSKRRTSDRDRTATPCKTVKPKPLIAKNTLKIIQNGLNKYKDSTSIDTNTFYSFVEKYQKEFTIISNEKDTNTDFLSIYQTLFGILSKIESQINESPSNDAIEKATNVFKIACYTPKIITSEFKSSYAKRLERINISLSSADTLAKLDKITEELKTVCEKDLGNSFKTVFEQRKKDLEQEMDKIDEIIRKINETEKILKKDPRQITFDRPSTTLEQAKSLSATLNDYFNTLKIEATVALSEAVKNALASFRPLPALGVIDSDVFTKIDAALTTDIPTPPATVSPRSSQRRRRKPSGQ